MKYSSNIFKTTKSVSADLQAKNARLLTQAGYIHQEVAGAYTFLPLGVRVLRKIEEIVREEMNTIGVEITMTSLSPKSNWEQTGRIETVDVLMKTSPANKAAKDKNDTEYILNSTHEDMVTPLVQLYAQSYKDLPVSVYQIQTKFRNEPRAKSGLLRCREFRMKDLYSFHTSEEDLMRFYEATKAVYMRVYDRLGIGDSTFITLASGGDFTTNYSHEFQTLCEAGEDTIFLDRKNNIAYNKEVTTEEDSRKLGVDFSTLEEVRACEVGNIFPLNTKFSKAFDYQYVAEDGTKHPIYMGSYGIGPSRLMGVLVEKFADDRGLIWPSAVAPFAVHLIDLNQTERGQEVYDTLSKAGIEVLWDDRDERAGAKFADADLLGIPVRLVVSAKTGDKIEFKKRTEKDARLVDLSELISMLSR
jgi:prolyl-tRNA synthetase